MNNKIFKKEDAKLATASFIAGHPKMVMYGIGFGATLAIMLALGSVVTPHNAFADPCVNDSCAVDNNSDNPDNSINDNSHTNSDNPDNSHTNSDNPDNSINDNSHTNSDNTDNSRVCESGAVCFFHHGHHH